MVKMATSLTKLLTRKNVRSQKNQKLTNVRSLKVLTMVSKVTKSITILTSLNVKNQKCQRLAQLKSQQALSASVVLSPQLVTSLLAANKIAN